MQTFREIYMQYAKDQLVAREEQKENEVNNNNDGYHDNNNICKEQLLMSRILLISTFYGTVNAVKHNQCCRRDVQSHIDNGSLLIVDAFNGYYPDVDGMKKLVVALSDRARKRVELEFMSYLTWAFSSCRTEMTTLQNR
jgi:hypothetical protein